MHEYFPKHSRMGTARKKKKETEEEGNKREVSMERSKESMKEKVSPDGLTIAGAYRPPESLRRETIT